MLMGRLKTGVCVGIISRDPAYIEYAQMFHTKKKNCFCHTQFVFNLQLID